MIASKCCSYSVQFDYAYDERAERWIGELRFKEHRRGAQYGGTVVMQIRMRKGASYTGLMLRAREMARKNINVFWT